MINTQTDEEIITKESIDQELLEKAMVDDKILNILDNIQLFLIVILVGVMIYITYAKIKEYFKQRRLQQEMELVEQQRQLMRNYEENQNKEQ